MLPPASLMKNGPYFIHCCYVALGVNRRFDEIPQSVSGFSFPLREPVMVGDKLRDRLPVHIYNQDPTMAPEGKNSMIIMLESDIEYWKELAKTGIYMFRKRMRWQD
jgi:hypothetical protein